MAASGFAIPRPAMSGALPCAGWEQAVPVAEVGGRRHAHAADERGGEIREDVPEHVLRHHHVELPRPAHQIEGGGVDVVVRGLEVRMPGRALVEDLAEEGHRGEHVRLVHAGDPASATARLAPRREPEARVEQALAGGAGDDHGVAGDPVVLHRPLAARGEQALGGLAHDDEIDVRAARVAERPRPARQRLDRTHPGVQSEPEAQVELRRDLGAVVVPHVGQAHRAEQDRVRRLRPLEHVLRHRGAGRAPGRRAGREVLVLQGESGAGAECGIEDRQGGVRHLGSDPVSGHDRDPEPAVARHSLSLPKQMHRPQRCAHR